MLKSLTLNEDVNNVNSWFRSAVVPIDVFNECLLLLATGSCPNDGPRRQ